ncbi:MAG TPA: hypothetical protein VH479_21900 [Acidimicrobiales bacterium]
MVDSDWGRWRRDVFGDPYLVWHDGPEFECLVRRERSDPGEVARMLALGVAESDALAPLAIRALAEAGRAPAGAEACLRAAAGTATGTFAVRLAQAMLVLTGDQSWSEPVLAVLAGDEFWGCQLDAAMALADFAPTARLIDGLARGVCDREYLVRYHSATTLRAYAGIEEPDISLNRELFDLIKADRDRAGRRQAADRLAGAARARLARP